MWNHQAAGMPAIFLLSDIVVIGRDKIVLKLISGIKRLDASFWILSLLFTCSLFYRTSTAVIADDLMKTFAISATSLGLIASAYFYSYAVVQIPVGIMCDRIGVRYTVACFGLIGVAGSVLLALSPGINEAFLARLLIGAGTAGVWVPALKYLSTHYRAEEFSTLSSIINLFGGLGILLATLPFALLTNLIGWRSPFLLAAALFFSAVALSWHLMDKEGCEANEAHPSDRNNFLSTKNELTENRKQKQGTFIPCLIFIFKYRAWVFVLWAFLFYGVLFTFTGLWGSSYLEESFQISKDLASTHLMFVSIGMMLGGLMWGALSDRVFKARRPILLSGSIGLTIIWIVLLSLSLYPGAFLVSAYYFIFGLCGIAFLVNFSAVKEYFPPEVTGTALGIVNMSMFIGVALFQGATGYLFDIIEAARGTLAAYQTIFAFCLGMTVLSIMIAFFMPETFPRTESRNKK